MVQIVNRAPTAGQLLGQGLGEGFSQTLTQRLQEKQSQKKRENALALLDADGDFMDLPFMEQQKKLFSSGLDPKDAQQISQNLMLNKKYEMEDKAKVAAAAKAAKVEERAASKEAREQEKFELEKTKPSGKQSVREKKMDEKAISYYDDIVRSQDKAARSEETIDRLWELSKKTEGWWGYAKAIGGSDAVSELRALGLSATDAVIASLFPNRVTDAKFKAVQDKFAISPWDSARTQRGKLRALKTFASEVSARGKRMDALIEEYGGDIDNVPSSKILELKRQGEQFNLDEIDAKADWIIEQSSKASEKEAEQQPQGQPPIEPTQGQTVPPIAPQPVETPSKPVETPSKPVEPPSKPVETPSKPQPVGEKAPSKEVKPPSKKKEATADKSKPDEGSLIPKEGSARLKRRLGALEKVRQTMDPKKFDALFADEIIDAYAEEGLTRSYGITGRGAAKGIGGLADFGSFLTRLITGSSLPVEEFTEKNFGKKMDFTELAEKSYDLLTSDEFIPKGAVERTYEKGVQMGTEFASPAAMMKSAKAGTLFFEGAGAGVLSNTAKEAGLGTFAQVVPYFLRPMATLSKKGAVVAREIVTNPAIMKEWAKGIKNWFSDKTKYLTSPLESLKEKSPDKVAETFAKRFDLKPEQARPERVKELQKKGMDKIPLSEVFSNEQVYAIEAKIAKTPEGREIYKPLLEELNQERISKYGEFLRKTSSTGSPSLYNRVSDPIQRDKLRGEFLEELTRSRSEADEITNIGYNALESKKRPTKDRISWKRTKKIVKSIDDRIEHIKKGGHGKYDEAAITQLENTRERLTMLPDDVKEKVKLLQQEVDVLKNTISPKSPIYAKNVAPLENKIDKLKNVGALVDEVEWATRKINRNQNYSQAFKVPHIQTQGTKHELISAINEWGGPGQPKRQQDYARLFRDTNKRYSNYKDTILSDAVWSVTTGKKPELIMGWLNNPQNVKDFRKMLQDTDLVTQAVGQEFMSAKIHEILNPKIFNSKGQVKATIAAINPKEEVVLAELLGRKNWDNLKKLSTEFNENSDKVQAYLNMSNTHTAARSDAKALAQVHGFWNLAKGLGQMATLRIGKGAKTIFKGAASLAATKSDLINATLMTDPKVQKALLNVVLESKKAKPKMGPLNIFAETLRKSLVNRVEGAGKTASLSDVLGIEEGLYPER